jgi:hypothetical protein
MSIKMFQCSPKFSVSECCNYSHSDICTMFSSDMINPSALYRCYASFTRNSDTLYRKLLIYFLIKLDVFITIEAHAHKHIGSAL